MCFARWVKSAWVGCLLLAALLPAIACSVRTPGPAQNGAAGLGGTSWQLVKFQSSDEKILMPDAPAKYTIAFGTDGSVSARIDCNRGRGTWNSSEPNQLQFGPLALTRAMCPPGSIHDRIVKDWEFVRSYTLKDGHLFLALMADGGIYEFAPIGGSESAANFAIKEDGLIQVPIMTPPFRLHSRCDLSSHSRGNARQ
jgi:heat shock protein HslJ